MNLSGLKIGMTEITRFVIFKCIFHFISHTDYNKLQIMFNKYVMKYKLQQKRKFELDFT